MPKLTGERLEEIKVPANRREAESVLVNLVGRNIVVEIGAEGRKDYFVESYENCKRTELRIREGKNRRYLWFESGTLFEPKFPEIPKDGQIYIVRFEQVPVKLFRGPQS